jgi:uncharacterized protein YndB with AHSA1/START domain
MADFRPGVKQEPFTISRLLKASPEAIFRAWSNAAYLKRWFAPEGVACPTAEVEFREGGAFNIGMRMQDGTDHLTQCRFLELVPSRRLVFAGNIISGGKVLFTVHTTVTFTAEDAGTRIHVKQLYEVLDEAAASSIAGAEAGWSSTLSQLATEAARLATPAVFGSFTLERVFAAPPSRVFHALIDIEAKAKWFGGGPEQVMVERYMDATPGGRERALGRWSNGHTSCFDAVYFDVVPDTRLVYAYEMHLNGVKISVSLATLELSPAGDGTRLVVTEQGSFLDGYADNGSREEGTGFLLDQLGASLGGPPLTNAPPPNCSEQN